MRLRFVFLSLLAVLAIVAVAALPGVTRAAPEASVDVPATQDTYVDSASAGSSFDQGLLFLNYGTGAGQVALLKFELNTGAVPLNSAKLGLGIVKGCNLAPINIVSGVDIYATTDGWNESTTWNTKPARGGKLASSDSATYGSANNEVTWTDNTSADGLLKYLQDEKAGDGVASIWVELPGAFGSQIVFQDSEKSGVTPGCTPADTIAPTIKVSDSSLPNSLTLRTFRSDDPAVSPLILGGAAIALLAVVAGVFVARRRRLAS